MIKYITKRAMLASFVFLILSSCVRKEYRYDEGIVWNTLYHITYDSAINLSDSILVVIDMIDGSLSPFNEHSTVSKINDNRTDSIDRHFEAVYKESLRINRESGGLFDPTLAPLIRAWGFGQGHSVSADTLRLDSLLQLVGIAKTALEPLCGSDFRNPSRRYDNALRLVKENPAIEFNFSALAKGYGVDCVADMLMRNGVENYLVEIGGEIRASGVNAKGDSWQVGIDSPEADASIGEAVEIVEVRNSGLATSGNYRNFHETDGRRFGHTLSPLTGRPVATDVISATVVAPTCMEADALATCCMAMGSEEALALCTRLKAGVFMILSDYSIVSNSFFPKIK